MPENNVKIELERKITVVFYTRTRVAVKKYFDACWKPYYYTCIVLRYSKLFRQFVKNINSRKMKKILKIKEHNRIMRLLLSLRIRVLNTSITSTFPDWERSTIQH